MIKKMVFTAAIVGTFAAGMFMSINDSEAKKDPPGGSFYELGLCYNFGGIGAACLTPSMDGPCYRQTSCY